MISLNELSLISKSQTQIYGNVKALIPLARERLALEFYRKGDNLQPKYRRGELVALKESLIFGLVTRNQVGHIPSVDVCFTEDEQTFIRDTYLYRALRSHGLQRRPETQNTENGSEGVTINVRKEIQRVREYSDFTIQPEEKCDQYI